MTSASFLGPHTLHTLIIPFNAQAYEEGMLTVLIIDEIDQKRVTGPGAQLKSSRGAICLSDTATHNQAFLALSISSLCSNHLIKLAPSCSR